MYLTFLCPNDEEILVEWIEVEAESIGFIELVYVFLVVFID